MKPKMRVLRALERRGYDRIPVHHHGTPEVDRDLMEHFGVTEPLALRSCLGDDLRTVGPVWVGPELRRFPDGRWEGWWGEQYTNVSFGHGTYPEAVYLPFADVEDPIELKDHRMPDPDDFDYSTIARQCARWQDYAVVLGGAGHLDFINGIARCRGVERVLLDLAERHPVFVALMNQRFEFFYGVFERGLEAAGGAVDLVHVGEDLGTQNGLLISPGTFDALFAEKYAAIFDLAHRYGARTMMHCCGSVRRLIPRLIELGLDVLDVVQVSAAGMDVFDLDDDFGDHLAFAGSVCVQSTLPFGTVADVEREVKRRMAHFKRGGLILGPSHQIQAGTPLENVLALYRTAGSLQPGQP
mgnify:FL=1